MKVVSNATPIISLSTIGRISLLHQLFGKIYIPREVYNELKSKKAIKINPGFYLIASENLKKAGIADEWQ